MSAASRTRVGVLVTVLCATYMISQFLRSSTGVIAPDLARELQLAPQSLGGLSGAFFFAFALSQIPVGLMLDRFGGRVTMTLLMGFAVAGSLLFAMARGLVWLSLARVLMGIGCSCLLMGPLMIYTRWFARARFATMSGVQIAAGTIGGVMATAPLAWMAQWFGWRGVFNGVALLTLLMMALVWLIVRDAPPGATDGGPWQNKPERESLWQSLMGLGAVLRNPSLPHLLVLQFTALGCMASILGLWASPYLHDIHGLDGPARGQVLLLMAAASAIGMLLWGPLDMRMDSRKLPVLAGAAASAVPLVLLAVLAAPGLATVTGLFAFMGFCNGYTAIAIAHGRAIFPDHLTGRGISLLNMGGMMGAGAFQYFSGVIAGQFAASGEPAPLIAYRTLFGFLAASLIGALLLYARVKDAPPSRDGQSA